MDSMIDTDKWDKVSHKYQEIVLEAYNKNQNFEIENSDIEHARFLSYLLIKKARKHIRIFTGNLNDSFYSDKRIMSALESLGDNVEVDIVVESLGSEFKSLIKLAKKRKTFSINKLKKKIGIKNHFLLSDEKSFRIESAHKKDDIEKGIIEGIANFNNPTITAGTIQIFNNEIIPNSESI